MSEPCSEKDKIEKLYEYHDLKMKQLHEMEKRQISIGGDVSHIKTRIDNGMSHTLAKLHEMLTALKPTIEHNSKVCGKVENIGWTLSTALILCVLGVIGWAIANGFKPGV